MKTSTQKRFGLFSGVLLLSLLVVVLAVQAARADPLVRTGPGSPIVSPVLASQGGMASTTPPAGTQGRGGATMVMVTSPSGVRPVSSGPSSTTVLILAGSAAFLIVLLAEWALSRRRFDEVAAATFCEQEPGSSLCSVS
jgi:hypothetical protein